MLQHRVMLFSPGFQPSLRCPGVGEQPTGPVQCGGERSGGRREHQVLLAEVTQQPQGSGVPGTPSCQPALSGLRQPAL